MDPELNDPKYQVVLAQNLTSDSAISRRSANLVLQRNGVDVNEATALAKKWKAGELPAQSSAAPSAAGGPIPSKPGMGAAEAQRMALALAGAHGSVSKLVATRYCKEHGIPINEFRSFAQRTAAAEEERRRR